MKRNQLAATPYKPGKGTTLEDEIMELADAYAELHCISSFLCSAMTAVMSSPEPLKEELVQGAKSCTEALLQRSQAVKEGIEKLRKRAMAESRSKRSII